MDRQDPVEHLAEVLERRADLLEAFPRPFGLASDAQALADWISRFGVSEEAFEAADGEAFLAARGGVRKALAVYLRRHDLQASLPTIATRPGQDAFVEWLLAHATPEGVLSASEVFAFREFARSEPRQLARQLLAYGGVVESRSRLPATVFDANRGTASALVRQAMDGSTAFRALLVDEGYLTPLAQLEVLYSNSATHRAMFPKAFHEQAATVELARYAGRMLVESELDVDASLDAWHERLLVDAAEYQIQTDALNVVGFHDAPTGMGRSARSLTKALSAAAYEVTDVGLPSPFVSIEAAAADVSEGLLFGWHALSARTSIIVANADEYPSIRAFMPDSFWRDGRHVGYWTWETQRLPARFGDALGLSELWVPSRYVAEAVRSVVDLPIHVVPHALDSVALAQAIPDRARFGIPDDVTAFGYVFDCKSVLERKNPAGLLAAFRQAFGTATDEAILVLKVSSPEYAPSEMTRLRDDSADLNVIWIESILDDASLLTLMASLDVYVSLHRSEGFGLTLAEAMALGKPVIASAYSGNLDFMTQDTAMLVAVTEVETDRDHGPYPVGTRWAAPDIDAAAGAMRESLDPDLRASRGDVGRKHVLSLLSPEAVGHRARQVLRRLA